MDFEAEIMPVTPPLTWNMSGYVFDKCLSLDRLYVYKNMRAHTLLKPKNRKSVLCGSDAYYVKTPIMALSTFLTVACVPASHLLLLCTTHTSLSSDISTLLSILSCCFVQAWRSSYSGYAGFSWYPKNHIQLIHWSPALCHDTFHMVNTRLLGVIHGTLR